MRTAGITLALGRHDHLAAQAVSLRRGTVLPDVHVVVAMDDLQLPAVVPEADVVHVRRVHGALPLAAARNAGVARATQQGAELLVLLDVDCLASAELVQRYARVASCRPGVLSGPVGYLPPRPSSGYPTRGLRELAPAHPGRPVPADDEVLPAPDPNLFWSLSFALTPATWDAVGGFCEDYYGYGGEDTDFGHHAVRAGVGLWWVGGAWAFHQHHGEPGPPVQHVDDILRNAAVFHRRWGWWPMQGWLEGFARQGLTRFDVEQGQWVRA